MSPEVIDSIGKPVLLVAILLVGAFAGIVVERSLSDIRRQAWRERNRWRWERKYNGGGPDGLRYQPKADIAVRRQFDAADQLRIVMGAHFAVQPLLNKSEARVFRELDRMVIDRNPAWQVMAQVSLGEILRSKDMDAYRCINSKRVDLLLVDDGCRPRHVVEYQGGAHHQGAAAARDAVKRRRCDGRASAITR